MKEKQKELNKFLKNQCDRIYAIARFLSHFIAMNQYISLAKEAVENYIKEGKIISPPKNLPEEYSRKAGAFVTIMKDNQLRGCIGTYLPTKENIAQEIIRNAISAVVEDYRFSPVQEEELPFLSYSVYILGEPELIKDIKKDPTKFSKEELRRAGLNPEKFGIIVKTEDIPLKSGLLLPDLEGIDTPEKQISIACRKGGIDPEKEAIIIYRFTVEKY